MEISLTKSECMVAMSVGSMRNLLAIFDNRRTDYGTGQHWQIHIEGACGEAAVAKALGIHNPWSINNFDGADLGRNIQVRTRSEHHYDLIVRASDKNNDVFVLVTGKAPHYQAHGWMFGGAAKQDEWLKDYGNHGPAWFVPQDALAPLCDIPEGSIHGT